MGAGVVYKNDWYIPLIKDHLYILEATFADGSLSSRVETTSQNVA